MFDFPTSPTVGQTYPPSPVIGVPLYTWDGEKWTTTGPSLVGQYVAKRGDTMTGALTLPADPSANLQAATRQYVDAKAAAATSIPATAIPSAGSGSGVVGTATKYAREDHAHPALAVQVPSGTVMLFYQAAAPVGWTKQTTQNDKALRVVSGSGGVAGGTNAFSSVMSQTVVGGHAIDGNELTYHNHYCGTTVGHNGEGFWTTIWNASGQVNLYYQIQSDYVGANWGHTHAITMGIQYIDLILASKD